MEVVEWIRDKWKLRAGEIFKDKKTVGAVMKIREKGSRQRKTKKKKAEALRR